ncbi:PID-CTERM protein-sorting domain-containing protein [uncultured Formosa sp.]|uniref:PID-CTERM protein-sorting domain-containing protein n=1 Tax=uncultured Formosa sp. TaxID=255435 RepID=UPI0026326BF6|nr:hypothetical protein [uncultured Formosa sp.]
MQNKYKLILLVFLLAGTTCFAQSGSNIPPTPSTKGVTPPGTPIDGGLSILIAAGAFYGIKKSLKR